MRGTGAQGCYQDHGFWMMRAAVVLFALLVQPTSTQLSVEEQDRARKANGQVEIKYCMS